jgi:hypothetical protein
MNKIQQLQRSIRKKIQEDDTFHHCRINVINGAIPFFRKYKDALATLESKEVTVRFYKDGQEVYDDLFEDISFMSRDWFNLFVYNLCGYKTSTDLLEKEIHEIELINTTLQKHFDSKYFSTLIISTMSLDDINEDYAAYTGSPNSIPCHRFLEPGFDEIYLLEYLNKTIHTHSSKFLQRWNEALNQLESLTSKPLPQQMLPI